MLTVFFQLAPFNSCLSNRQASLRDKFAVCYGRQVRHVGRLNVLLYVRVLTFSIVRGELQLFVKLLFVFFPHLKLSKFILTPFHATASENYVQTRHQSFMIGWVVGRSLAFRKITFVKEEEKAHSNESRIRTQYAAARCRERVG